MAITPDTLRSREITICGHRLAIRTDLDESALAEIVTFAEERLVKQGLYAASEDVKRLLLPFLVLCGEFLEQKKLLTQKEEQWGAAIGKIELFSRQLGVAFDPPNEDIESG